jgi:hypothetical protein
MWWRGFKNAGKIRVKLRNELTAPQAFESQGLGLE